MAVIGEAECRSRRRILTHGTLYLTVSAGITLVVLAIMAGVLARNMVAPSVAVVGAVVALLVMGVLTPQEAFAGFSNPAPLTVAALYVLARGIEKTGALQPIVSATLGGASSPRRSLGRLLVPSATASAFLNNTPIVAMLMPQVSRWAEEWNQPVSRYLMPLSFAAILGGTVTLIGTSTNLVISGLLEAGGEPPLSMFELARVGLPVAVIGVIFVVMAAPTLLPDRRSARHAVEEAFREFTVAMIVEPRGPLDGTTVEGGRLRHLQGVFLVEIERQGDIIAPVAPETVLRGRDRLTFVGRADQVVDLQGIRGLESSEREHLSKFDSIGHTFFEAVVGPTSPLNGRTLREMGFRNQYQAAVVAIHRAGHRVKAKLGGVKLRVGDTLLLLSDPGFEWRWRDRSPFLWLRESGGRHPPFRRRHGWQVP